MYSTTTIIVIFVAILLDSIGSVFLFTTFIKTRRFIYFLAGVFGAATVVIMSVGLYLMFIYLILF